MTAYCAICAGSITGEPHREPLGKDDAMVNVCDSCTGDMAVAKRGPERSYEGGGPMLSAREAKLGVVVAVGKAEYDRISELNERSSRTVQPARDPNDVIADDVFHEGERRRRTGASRHLGRRSGREKTVAQ